MKEHSSFLSSILLILLILSLLSACGSAEQPAETAAVSTTEKPVETTDDGLDENGFLRDDLPELD